MSTARALAEVEGLLRARYALVFLESSEEARWLRELARLAKRLDRGFRTWTLTEGLAAPGEAADPATRDAHAALEVIAATAEPTVFVLADLHALADDPWIARRVRDLEEPLARRGSALVFLGASARLPPELDRDVAIVAMPLPDVDDLAPYVARAVGEWSRRRAASDASPPSVPPEVVERMERALLGLPEAAARKVLRRVLLGRRQLDDEVVRAMAGEKRRMLAGSALLEFVEARDALDSVGGMGELKRWVARRRRAFGREALARGLEAPRGVLLLGVQGCGKSLAAKAIAREWGFPLVRLDLSAVVRAERAARGESLRGALAVVERLAPAVLWVDELEKGFARAAGASDGAVERALGGFVTWLEEKEAPVFVAATANRIDALPPENLRKGRFDEIFFVDLPSLDERADILRVHLARRQLDADAYDVRRHAVAARLMSGAEIEQAVLAACWDAFDEERAPGDDDLDQAIRTSVPLAISMREEIESLRDWARGRARPVSLDTRLKDMISEAITDDR